MTSDDADAWSPASNAYSIAVSEAQWWLWSVELCARRMRDGDDPARQIDSRLFILALRQVLYAAEMEQQAIRGLSLDVRRGLGTARGAFAKAVPGVVEARDRLVHFPHYARGEGNRQLPLIKEGADAVAVARDTWPYGYDPVSRKVHVGLLEIDVEQATAEARRLFWAVYVAATAFDDAAGANRAGG